MLMGAIAADAGRLWGIVLQDCNLGTIIDHLGGCGIWEGEGLGIMDPRSCV
jgi:hypothetical protein